MRTIILKIQEPELGKEIYIKNFQIFKSKKKALKALFDFYKQNINDYHFDLENEIIVNCNLFQKRTAFGILNKNSNLKPLLRAKMNLVKNNYTFPECNYTFNELLKILTDSKIQQSLIFENN
jgi:hypothetical protein